MVRIIEQNLFHDQKNRPIVVLIGTSFQFSDQLLRMMRIGVEDAYFVRMDSLDQLAQQERKPRVAIIHEDWEDLEEWVEALRCRLPGTLIAIACSDPAVLWRFRTYENVLPISALQMNTQVDVWFSILRLLLSGHPYVPARLGPQSPSKPDAGPFQKGDAILNAPLPDAIGPAKLTPREMEILPLIALGEQNKTIADRLGLSIHTVKLHNHNIFSKLGVSNRTGAANWYLSQMMEDNHVKARSRALQKQ